MEDLFSDDTGSQEQKCSFLQAARCQSITLFLVSLLWFSLSTLWTNSLESVLRRIPELTSHLFPQPIRKGQREVYAGLEHRGF